MTFYVYKKIYFLILLNLRYNCIVEKDEGIAKKRRERERESGKRTMSNKK